MSKTLSRICLVATLSILPLSQAFAGITDGAPGGNLPAPGILGLVALGVVGAIAIARHRK